MEKLLAAAGIRVFVKHRYQPGIVCLVSVSDIRRDNALSVPGDDFKICIQSPGCLNRIRFYRVFYSCIVKQILSASLDAVTAGDGITYDLDPACLWCRRGKQIVGINDQLLDAADGILRFAVFQDRNSDSICRFRLI